MVECFEHFIKFYDQQKHWLAFSLKVTGLFYCKTDISNLRRENHNLHAPPPLKLIFLSKTPLTSHPTISYSKVLVKRLSFFLFIKLHHDNKNLGCLVNTYTTKPIFSELQIQLPWFGA